MSPEHLTHPQMEQNAYYPTLPPKRSPYGSKKVPVMSGARQDAERSNSNEAVSSIDQAQGPHHYMPGSISGAENAINSGENSNRYVPLRMHVSSGGGVKHGQELFDFSGDAAALQFM